MRIKIWASVNPEFPNIGPYKSLDIVERQKPHAIGETTHYGPVIALPQDVQLRTIGLRRAAVRSLPIISPRTRADLEAYADGVNVFVGSHSLPPEYGVLELTQFEPWTVIDSLAVGKLISFGLSFDLDIDPTVALLSYEKAGSLPGFDGTKLFFEDLDRSAPFDPASTIPDASLPHAWTESRGATRYAGRAPSVEVSANGYLEPRTVELAKEYSEKTKGMPVFERLRDRKRSGASNEWAISGQLSASNVPLLANDPHLSLVTPSTFYPCRSPNRCAGIKGFLSAWRKLFGWRS
jgi:penicillin amidase